MIDESTDTIIMHTFLIHSCPVSSVGKYRMTLEAFSEDHLKTFYFNPLLEQMEGFVEHFIRVNKVIKQTIQLLLIVSQNKTFSSHCER